MWEKRIKSNTAPIGDERKWEFESTFGGTWVYIYVYRESEREKGDGVWGVGREDGDKAIRGIDAVPRGGPK